MAGIDRGRVKTLWADAKTQQTDRFRRCNDSSSRIFAEERIFVIRFETIFEFSHSLAPTALKAEESMDDPSGLRPALPDLHRRNAHDGFYLSHFDREPHTDFAFNGWLSARVQVGKWTGELLRIRRGTATLPSSSPTNINQTASWRFSFRPPKSNPATKPVPDEPVTGDPCFQSTKMFCH